MANLQCDSCESLREVAPNLIVNGFTETECKNLRANNGLSGDSENCPDVHDMNDCFVGMMDNEVDAYDTCDWKKFMHSFIPNLWATLKAIICWLCGVQCMVDHLFEGANLEVGEDSSDGSYIKPGGGVSYLFDSDDDDRTSDVQCLYIAGGLLRVQGSFRFFSQDFTDKDGKARQGNHHWAETGPMTSGGELICEIYIKRSQFGVKNIYAGFGQETGGYGYHLNATVFSDKDSDGNPVYAYGQHGNCNSKTGQPAAGSGHSVGHKVPEGYIIIQLRMSYIWALNHNGNGTVSPRAFMGIRFNPQSIKC